MLQILRKKAQSTFIQIIVVIIALVFIFWGVGTNMSGDRQAALMVNDEEITFQEFQDAYDRAYQQFSDQFGGNVPKGLAESFGIKQQVINQLIQTTLLKQGAREMGIHISGREIGEFIKEMVQFQENGTFSMDKYKAVLSANRMAPTKFESSMRVDRLAEVAAREIGNFGTIATDFEVQELYGKMNEKVGLTFVKFSPSAYKDSITVDEEELMKWFDGSKENYKTEPQVKLAYLPFTFSKVAEKIDIDEANIEQYYRENISSFTTPEKRRARHILLKAGEEDTGAVHAAQLQKAEEILSEAKGGSDFAELARKFSEGPSRDNGGDLGFFSAGQMVPAFNQAVFNMQVGDISSVVKTQFGYHIILLEEIQQAEKKPLAEVASEIRKKLQMAEAESLAFQVANAAYEGIIGAGSLEKYIAATPDAEMKETDFFTRSNAPQELKVDGQFLSRAFELNKGELSSLIKGNTGFIILFAKDIKEPELPALEDIKEKVTEDYIIAKSQEMAQNTADAFLEQLKNGKNITDLAAEEGLTTEESGLLSQNSQDYNSAFQTTLIQDAFLLSTSSPFPEKPGAAGDDFFVYSFLERQTPAMPEDDQEKEKYTSNLLQFKKRQVVSAWLKNLESRAEITQHRSLQ